MRSGPLAEAARLLAAASLADNTDAQVEYAIALFNGAGVARNEPLAAALLRKAAHKGNPVAQNRLANILAVGRGLKADPVEAIKWHMVAKAAGVSDMIPQWAGGLPADAPPRPGTAKYDEFMRERERKRLEPAPAKDDAGNSNASSLEPVH